MSIKAAGIYSLWVGVLSSFIYTLFHLHNLEQVVVEFMLIGRIPGTETQLSFEAMAFGSLFALWSILTYRLTVYCVTKIHNKIRVELDNLQRIEEIAL